MTRFASPARPNLRDNLWMSLVMAMAKNDNEPAKAA